MKNIRRMISRILLEKEAQKKKLQVLDSSGAGQEGEFDFSTVEDILDIIKSWDFSTFGYNTVSVDQPDDTAGLGMMSVDIVLQHVKPDFAHYMHTMRAKGGKFGLIFGDTPTSKTQITRWLTGFKSDPDARQKSAAIKVAQVTGLAALQPLLDEIESKYQVTCAANFTGAKTKNKGQSFFEIFIMPPYIPPGQHGIPGDSVKPPVVEEPPEQPSSVPVDGEDVKVIEEPKPIDEPPTPKIKKPKKRRKKRIKKRKLSKDQRKAGYTDINQQGHVRHVLSEDELETIADHAVNLIIKGEAKVLEKFEASEAHDLYKEVRIKSDYPNANYYRVVDDYYNDPLPILKFHSATIYVGGKVKSRSMMSQYRSTGSNKWFPNPEDPSQTDTMYGVDDEGYYTPPKLGSKDVKDARRHVSDNRSSDEIIIYAQILPTVNKYTGQESKHTGDVTLHVFLLDRSFSEEN